MTIDVSLARLVEKYIPLQLVVDLSFDVTRRRKPSEYLWNEISRKKGCLDIKIYFLKKRRSNTKDLRNKKGSVGKGRVGSKSGQITRQSTGHVRVCRHGEKLEKFYVNNGEF